MSGSNKLKIDPTIVQMVGNSKKTNAGHALADMFTNLGTISNNKIKQQDAELDRKIKTAKYESVSSSLADDKIFAAAVIDENPTEYLKQNPLKTGKYAIQMDTFLDKSKNELNSQQQKKYMGTMENKFTNEDGTYNTKDALSSLQKEYNDGHISTDVYHNVSSLIQKQTKWGMYGESKNAPSSLTTDQKNFKAEQEDNEYKEWRVGEKQSRKLTGDATYNQIVNKQIDLYSNKLETTNFADVDFEQVLLDEKITPNEKRKLERTLASSKEARTLENNFGKYKAEYSTIEGQADRFAKYANSKELDTNIVQNGIDVVKSFIPGFNPSQEEIENFEFRSDFINLSSTILRLQSGLTVSDKERQQFERSMGTLSKNKKVNFIGIKQKLLDKKNALEGIKTTAPEYFNVKYGHTLRSLDKSISSIDGYINNEEPEKQDNQSEVITIINPRNNKPTTSTQSNVIDSTEAFDKLLGL